MSYVISAKELEEAADKLSKTAFESAKIDDAELPTYAWDDPVNHPSHYTDGGIETIDFIEAKKLPYHLGNVVKYVSRAGKKIDLLEDLRKAQWYLDRYIKLLEKDGCR